MTELERQAVACKGVMRWHYFRREGNKLVLEDDDVLREQRPSDARPDNGNPHTPWYEEDEHFDEEHVHVRGMDAEHAQMRAISMVLADQRAGGSP